MTTSPWKSSIIERWNRTLKSLISKHFIHTDSTRYVNDLQRLVDLYNSTKHSTILMKPNEVTPQTVPLAYSNTHRKQRKLNSIPSAQDLQVNDYVRVVEKKKTLGSGVLQPQFSKEIFQIVQVFKKKPQTMYSLKTFNGKPINGRFYEPELLKCYVPPDTIVKILKIRNLGSQKQMYVKTLDEQYKWI